MRSQLNWTQYRTLIQITDADKREYYELAAANNGWTARELERQKNSLLYERLLKSNDKEAVLAVARGQRTPEAPTEIVKDPMYLEFLGLEQKPHYYESDLEDALITNLQEFLLELGNGFSFVARQKRFLIEDDEYKVDLVFYNRLLRCFVLIDLKTHKATGAALGIVGISSYAAAGAQSIVSGFLIEGHAADGVYDFGPVSVFWIVACLIAFVLPVIGWKYLRNRED